MNSALARSTTSHIVVTADDAPAASSARPNPDTPSPRITLPRSVSHADKVTSCTPVKSRS